MTRHRLSFKEGQTILLIDASVINLRDPSVRAERQEINAGRGCPQRSTNRREKDNEQKKHRKNASLQCSNQRHSGKDELEVQVGLMCFVETHEKSIPLAIPAFSEQDFLADGSRLDSRFLGRVGQATLDLHAGFILW